MKIHSNGIASSANNIRFYYNLINIYIITLNIRIKNIKIPLSHLSTKAKQKEKVVFADLKQGNTSTVNNLSVNFFDARKKCTFLSNKKVRKSELHYYEQDSLHLTVSFSFK